jgi:hypothetical protein
MSDIELRSGRMFLEVLRRTHLSTAADIPAVAVEEARAIGVQGLVLYLADHEQRLLVPVPGPGAEGREPLSVNGTVAGRSYAAGAIIDVEGEPDGRRIWLPLLDGTERFGVVEMTFADTAEPPTELVLVCERLAHLLAALVANKDPYSDFFTLVRRRQPMTMASELLRELVPPQVLATEDFVLATLLEPCYDVGGDAYDYAINGDVLHLAVFDAVGHGLTAAGVSAFTLAAYRFSRRRHHSLADTYAAIDEAVLDQYGESRFVTGLITELDVRSGRLRWITAGHPAPLLLRGGRLVGPLVVPPSTPLGLELGGSEPVEGVEDLEPGDMVLFYTDGLTEARRPGGELFTDERLGEFIERQAASGLPAPETLRGLREAIIGSDAALRDDATAVLVEWRRGSERDLLPHTVM